MSSTNQSGISHAIHALTKAMEHAHQHRRTLAHAAYAGTQAPPAAPADTSQVVITAGGAA